MNVEALLVLALMIFIIGVVLKRGSGIDIARKVPTLTTST